MDDWEACMCREAELKKVIEALEKRIDLMDDYTRFFLETYEESSDVTAEMRCGSMFVFQIFGEIMAHPDYVPFWEK